MSDLNIFYCKIPATADHYGGFSIVAAYNRGHAVTIINKKLKAEGKPPISRDVPVEEFVFGDKKGAIVLEYLEGWRR